MRRWDLLCVCCTLLAVAAWIACSSIHRFHNSDTLLHCLISLYRWTPVYWEHNRVGTLLPLLAVPFRHPFANLLVQSGLAIGAGLANFFLLGYYVAGRRRGIAIGAWGALWFVLLVHIGQQFGCFINNSHYVTSLALALLALLALRHWDRQADGRRIRDLWQPVAATTLICVALWVNPSLAFALGPLILLRRFLLRDAATEFDRLDAAQAKNLTLVLYHSLILGSCATGSASASHGNRRISRGTGVASGTPILSRDKALAAAAPVVDSAAPSWRPGLLHLVRGYPAADWIAFFATAVGLLISMAISRWAATYQEHYAFLPPGDWLACAIGVCRNLPEALHKNWLLAVALTGAAGLVTLRWPAGRRALPSSLAIAFGLLIPALVQFAFMTSLNVVHSCNCPRYVFVSAMLWQAACLAFCVLQWTSVLPDQPRLRRVPYALLILLCLAAMARHGRSGLDVARRALDQNAGPITDEVLAARCTHVTGNYWHVWKTVYHANRRLADRGAAYTVWGICQRCLPTADQWTRVPLAETRIAVPIGDENEADAFLAQYVAAPMTHERAGQTLRVLRPTVSLSEAWPARVRR